MRFSLRNPILATIIYYDIFDRPLTLIEVFKYLINPGRLNRLASGYGDISLGMMAEELKLMLGAEIIGEKNGFYFLPGRSGLFDLRMERDKIANRKWKKFLRVCRWLQLAPYLRGIFGSGSMAIGNTDEKSDFDVLIIAKSGRLYTCRFFLWLISSVMGTRRKKYEKTAPDKLCFNHYLTDGNLAIRHESLFNAQMYINLKPVLMSRDLTGEFYGKNIWLNNYAYNFRVQKDFVRRSVKPGKILLKFARFAEFTLGGRLGDIVENVLKKNQQARIAADPRTYEPGGRIVFTDKELEFHPHSAEKKALAGYRNKLQKLGLGDVEENDSGLRRTRKAF